MKYLIVICAIFLSIASCAPKNVNIQESFPLARETQTAGVGDLFFHYEALTGQDNGLGTVFGGQAFMFELTVSQIAAGTISLQYREFAKPVGPQGGYRINEAWLVKKGFNQEYKFELASKLIKFREFEFVVIESSSNSIKFQRIL